jgi:hypothetical protein
VISTDRTVRARTTHLEEGTLVVVLLHEALVALLLLAPRLLCARHVLGIALGRRHGAPPLDLGLLLLALAHALPLALQALQLAQPPGAELGVRIAPVGVVQVGHVVLRRLCGTDVSCARRALSQHTHSRASRA